MARTPRSADDAVVARLFFAAAPAIFFLSSFADDARAAADEGAAAAATTGRAVMVLPIGGDADARTRAAWADALRAALAGYGFIVRSGPETTVQMRTAAALGERCAAPAAAPAQRKCALRVGALAGVDVVVLGTATKSGAVALRAVSVAQAADIGAAGAAVKPGGAAADPAALARHARLLSAQLTAPDRIVGKLTINAPAGATVSVGGALKGTAPLTAPLALAIGKHEIYVAQPGFVSFVHEVDIEFEDDEHIDVRLAAEPGAPVVDAAGADAPSVSAGPTVVSVGVSADGAAPTRLLVVDLAMIAGVDADMARMATDAVVIGLSRRPTLQIVSGADLRQLVALEAVRQEIGCMGDASCMSELAGSLGARFIVYGTLGRLGDLYVVQLNCFDAQAMRAVGRAAVEVEQVEQLSAHIDDAVDELMADLAPRPATASAAPMWLIGGGAAVAIAGAVVTAVSLASYVEALSITGKPDPTAAERARHAELEQRWNEGGQALSVVGGVAFFAGAVLVVGGALMLE